jgi:peptidoglycan lytic transglycosylase
MQTKLRIAVGALVVGLLWFCPAPAAAQKAHKQQVDARTASQRWMGTASWYGKQHQGRKMANGKPFDKNKMTAASWYFPLGTIVRVRNLENNKSVIVTITDRGPNLRLHRLIDLSEAAARKLGYVEKGLTRVFIDRIISVETLQASIDPSLIAPASNEIAKRTGD